MDRNAFEDAFNAYVDKLCRYVYGYVGSVETAQDLVSDVYFNLWRRLAEADGRDLGEPIRDFERYLYRSARHHAIDYLRRQRLELSHRRDAAVAAIASPPIVADAMQDLMERESLAALQRAVDQLPPRQREITLLKWERQATTDEIARRLGLSPATVTEHFRRALARLRELLHAIRAGDE